MADIGNGGTGGRRQPAGIPVVGLGGSAGAFDAFREFFRVMPPDSGSAFVVIQHMAPTHKSLLPELLAQHTTMTVAQALERQRVEPGCVYVIPPDSYLGIRDGAAFEELRAKVVAPLIQSRQPDEPMRVWVAGCSSGEEVYSIVMLLLEEMTAARKTISLQVFATDIDEEALQFARHGVYPESIETDIGPLRAPRFFGRTEQGYQVGDALRDAVVFATQNLIADPPFSRMDLISCRNLLICLNGDAQARLFPLFNFALRPGGYLFLGKSETIAGEHELFDVVAKKARIYRRRASVRPIILDATTAVARRWPLPAGPPVRAPTALYAEVIRQALLAHFGAAVVLTDAKGTILQFHGRTGAYLDLPAGDHADPQSDPLRHGPPDRGPLLPLHVLRPHRRRARGRPGRPGDREGGAASGRLVLPRSRPALPRQGQTGSGRRRDLQRRDPAAAGRGTDGPAGHDRRRLQRRGDSVRPRGAHPVVEPRRGADLRLD